MRRGSGGGGFILVYVLHRGKGREREWVGVTNELTVVLFARLSSLLIPMSPKFDIVDKIK